MVITKIIPTWSVLVARLVVLSVCHRVAIAFNVIQTTFYLMIPVLPHAQRSITGM